MYTSVIDLDFVFSPISWGFRLAHHVLALFNYQNSREIDGVLKGLKVLITGWVDTNLPFRLPLCPDEQTPFVGG